MDRFTHETKGYELVPAYLAFRRFLDCYLLERDYEKTSAFVDEDFYSFGTGKGETATDKAAFAKLLKAELEAIPEKIAYKLNSVYGKEIAEGIWNVLAELDVVLPNRSDEKIVYATRFTGCFRLVEDCFVLLSMHISEPSGITEEKEFLPLKYANRHASVDKKKTEQTIFDLMSKSMPGGIISGYAQEGFPLYFVNDRYLELLGYSSYEEYYEAANGLGITHIHPDDVEMVNEETMHSYSTDTQYEIDYRIRHKDGHYIHVYDIGKKMITPDQKEVVICVLYDMTEDAKLKEVLRRESSYDVLTGIYNRRGGLRAIEHALEHINAYAFAFFDIDNLKLLNDNYSHKVGDTALKYFVELFKSMCDKRTILARFGGDEFIAFIDAKLERTYLENLFSNLEQKYCHFIKEQYPDSESSISIGCITGYVSGKKKCNFDELCQEADELMYEIKKNGKRGYKIVEVDR